MALGMSKLFAGQGRAMMMFLCMWVVVCCGGAKKWQSHRTQKEHIINSGTQRVSLFYSILHTCAEMNDMIQKKSACARMTQLL